MPTLERWFCKLALAAVLALVVPGPPGIAAEAPPPETEAAKAEIVARILEGRAFESFKERDLDVCLPLLEALRAGGAALKFVEPIVRAEYYHDEALLPYRAMCPGMELNKRTELTGDPFVDGVRGLPEAERYDAIEATARIYFSTRNFKLYRVDLDHDPTNGEEYVFYGERQYIRDDVIPLYLRYEEIPRSVDWNDILPPENVPGDAKFYSGQYTILDLDRCERLAITNTYDPYDYVAGRAEDNHNAIIRLQGRHYILRLMGDRPKPLPPARVPYWVDFQRFNDGDFFGYCSFHEKKEEK